MGTLFYCHFQGRLLKCPNDGSRLTVLLSTHKGHCQLQFVYIIEAEMDNVVCVIIKMFQYKTIVVLSVIVTVLCIDSTTTWVVYYWIMFFNQWCTRGKKNRVHRAKIIMVPYYGARISQQNRRAWYLLHENDNTLIDKKK